MDEAFYFSVPFLGYRSVEKAFFYIFFKKLL
jgi:hypothetical protein